METIFQIAIAAALLSAFGAIGWMMFHGRQFLPDAVREEFRESQRRLDEQMPAFFRQRWSWWILVFVAVLALGLAMAEDKFWSTSSWTTRVVMVVSRPPLIMVVIMFLWSRFRRN